MADNDDAGNITFPMAPEDRRRLLQGAWFADNIPLSAEPSLKSLEAFNEEARRRHRLATEPHGNGIACPKCGAELRDSNPMMMLTSDPPQMNVHCPACDYYGTRVA